MEESELIQRLRKGEDDAFEFVFRQSFSRLCLLAEHYVRNHQTAEEIVEDFFCHLWDNCHNLSIETSLQGYLHRSIHNRCLNYIRNQKVKQQYLDENQYYFTDEEILEPASSEQHVSNMINRELGDCISTAINSLPEQCRSIFCMNRFENLTYKEIADHMGISINTVKTQMARALQKLRESLKYCLVILFTWLPMAGGFFSR
jgi:RNA polymerase sigma-70 factor, ECF subfamily